MPPVSFPATTGLRFDWLYPEPPVINYQLLQLEKYLANTEVLAQEAMKIAQADMDEHFQTETDPEGNAWEELERPAENQIGILALTDYMHERAISDEAWTATPQGVFFRTDVLPDYWVFHEQPEGQGAQRIPRRSFIGYSADAERRVEGIAEAWLAAGVNNMTKFRGMGGRFVRLS